MSENEQNQAAPGDKIVYCYHCDGAADTTMFDASGREIEVCSSCKQYESRKKKKR